MEHHEYSNTDRTACEVCGEVKTFPPRISRPICSPCAVREKRSGK